MVHTLPDYTSKWKTKTISAIVDNAELAARLGSINTYDRRGNTIWMDDFEGATLKWDKTLSGAGAAATINAEHPYRGSQHLKLVGGSTANWRAQVIKYFSYLHVSNIGAEVAFTADANVLYFILELLTFDGTYYTEVQIWVDPINDELSYLNSAGITTVFDDTIDFLESTRDYHILKVVMDPINNRYVRGFFDDTEYDMSAYPARHELSGISPSLQAGLYVYSNGATNAVINCDSFILTQNEV